MTYESPEAQEARIDVAAMLGSVVRRLPRVLLVTVALLVAVFILLLFVPRMYESSASILVEPRANVYSRATNEQASSLTGGETGVVSSQIELIKSRDTLLTVIDRLDLRSVPEFNGSGGGGFSPMGVISKLFGRGVTPDSIDETVLNALNDRLTVAQAKDSRIISVSVSSTSPQLASDIANAIASAHVARRAELSLSDTAEASTWLREEINKLRVTVTAAETAVAKYKVDNDLFVGSNNTSLLEQQLSTIAGQITDAQGRKNAALSRAALIRGMIERGQPIEGIADARDSVLIQQLSQEKARLQGEKAQRSATLLSNHPTIKALDAQIAELNNQIGIEGRRVADALEAEGEIESGLETSLQSDLTRAKTSTSTATQDTVALDALEREAKAQRDLLEGYLQRYSEAVSRTDSNSALPDVRVVSVAAPSVVPASPNTQLALISTAFVSIAVQIGIIIFGELLSGRAIVRAHHERPQDELEEMPYVEDEVERAEAPEVHVEADEHADEVPAEPQREKRFARLFGKRDQSHDEIVAEIEGNVTAEVVEPEVVEAIVVEPVDVPVLAPVAPKRPSVNLMKISDLASDLALGRTHLVMLAAHNSHADCEILAEKLVGDAIARGLSVALIDAGSRRAEDELGLTDLSSDAASFGDVVHKSADNSFAEVPWGRGRAISRNSKKPMTLVEALGDIYEVVVLMTGQVGMSSSLPFFDGLQGRLVLVSGADDDLDAVAQTRDLLINAGFDNCEIAAAPERVAA